VIYSSLGRYENALVTGRKAVGLNPEQAHLSAGLAATYMNLNRFAEAGSLLAQELVKKPDSSELHALRYALAFLQNEPEEMKKQVAWSSGTSREDSFLLDEARTAAYFGGFLKARELARRAITLSERRGDKNMLARNETASAYLQALAGNSEEATGLALSALSHTNGDSVLVGAALALALAGDAAKGPRLAEDIAKRAPDNTLMQSRDLPTLRAQLWLNRKNPQKAIEALEVATTYDLSDDMFTVYLRGKAY